MGVKLLATAKQKGPNGSGFRYGGKIRIIGPDGETYTRK
jgi:hypothetical protein